MSDSTKKIKQDIESERVSRSKLGREDLEKLYLDLEKEDFPSDKRIKFIGDLTNNPVFDTFFDDKSRKG